MRLTYFIHDLTDPAALRRIRMLRRGGVDVQWLLGFRRSPRPVAAIDGIPVIDLGQTFPRSFGHRSLQVMRHSATARKWRHIFQQTDVVLARNLEMITIADAARIQTGSSIRMVYECLDIHHLVLGNTLIARMMRNWERHILRRSDVLITSSPAYLTQYFERLGMALPKVILAENKGMFDGMRPHGEERQPPWRIGCFGGLRCANSFHILRSLAQSLPNLVDVQLNGQPTSQVAALIDQYLPLSNMRFGGSFSPDELGSLYGACDFAWAVDYYQQNSKWCLPNRIYEGGFYNRPPFVIAGTATAEWAQARGLGVVLNESNELNDLTRFFRQLTPAEYQRLHQASINVPTNDLVWTEDACREFVRGLEVC